MITPVRRPAHRGLLDWEKEFSTAVNRIRYVIEQVIANFKTWRVMHTDYRRPLANIPGDHLSRNRTTLLRDPLITTKMLTRQHHRYRCQAVLTTVPAPSSAATSSAGAVVSVTRVCTSAEAPT
jgi:hypothetical protein